MLDESLRQKVLQSQISDMSYKITNGKKLSNKNFYEGIVNPGTVDIVSAPDSKITKDMILDYRQKEEERTYKNAAGEDVKYQETGLTGDLVTYKPIYVGDDVDLAGAKKDLYAIVSEGKKRSSDAMKLTKEFNKLVLKSREIYEIILNTPIYNIRAKRSLYREEARLKRDMAELEKRIEEANDEVQEITKDALAKQEEIKVIEANIKDNEKEEAIVQKKNRDIAKEYGEKFNLLNRQQQQVGQQPNESDDAYIKRLKDLENLKADPTLYKQKAINENVNKLKNNLKQIVKDTGKIDQIVANFRDDDDAYILNSYWSQISEYLKKYGFDVNNKDLNYLKLVDELKAAIQNIKVQPFNINTAATAKTNSSNTPTIVNSSVQAKKISDDVLELMNFGETNSLKQKLYIKLLDKGEMAYSKDNINYSKFGFQTKKEKPNPLDEPKNNFFFDIIKYFNSNLVPKSEDYKKIFGDSKIKSDIYAHIQKKLKDPKVGSGIKKGCGMQPIEETKEIDKFNEEIPKVINFGKNKLLLNKLYYNNILSVKDGKMHSIETLKNQHVSDEFVKVIYNIYNNQANNDINLSDKELELFHLLLFVSGLNKKKNIDIKRDDNVHKLKERLLLVESQIKAGNNNPVVKEELKQIIKKLYLYKAISLNNAKEYIKQFNK
jgi:hypothetical protein